MSTAPTLFWISLAAVAFSYVGYPLLLALVSRWWRREVRKAPCTPSVSVVVTVHDGAAYLRRKLENLFALDYPRDRFEVVLVSDGSTDATVEIARAFPESRLHLIELPVRYGKPTALNAGVTKASGEVLVFNDVRQTMAPDAVRELVANFSDPKVGSVTGKMLLADCDHTLQSQLGAYYRYEQWIRRKESAVHSMIGAAGALSATRRALFRPLPKHVILDDVYTPMQIVLQGYRSVFDPAALGYDPHDSRPEFHRKLRTLTGNYQLLLLLPDILSFRNPLLAQYLGHKVSRLLVPFFLVGMYISSAWIASGFYGFAFGLQTVFYAMAISFPKLQKVPALTTISGTAFSFLMANCAALLGLFMFLRGKKDIWV